MIYPNVSTEKRTVYLLVYGSIGVAAFIICIGSYSNSEQNCSRKYPQ